MLPLNRFGVRFKDGVARAQIDSLNATLGVRILREPSPDSGFVDYWFAYPPGAGSDPLRIAAQYDQHPFVRYAHPDMINETELTSVPTDPYYTFQYYLKNATTYNGINVDINVEPAWNVEPTMGCGAPSAGCVAVAVIDDGVQAAHPDFGGRVAFGYDVFGNNTLGCSGCANNPSNDPSHGTQVAGIILGQHDGQGIAGVAPGARVVPVRMFRPITEGGGASDLQIADGIRFAWYFAEAAVLNNSWDYTDPNYPGNAAVTNAISDAVTQGRGGKGAVVVFAAGNTSDREGGIIGRVAYPARLSTVITVGAIDRSGYITNYSPEGSELDLVAPSGHYVPRFGEECTRGDVVTTDLLEYRGCSDGPSSDRDYTSTFSGTSAAAPQVSGVAALLLAKEPGLTQTQVKSHLQSSADYWGLATKFGAGKINAYQALQTPFTVSISGPTFIDTPGTYTWTANAAGGDGTYSYQWQESTNGSTYFNVGTGKTYSESENSDASFYLRVNVTSAGQTTSKTVHVTVQTSCDPGDMC